MMYVTEQGDELNSSLHQSKKNKNNAWGVFQNLVS